MKKFVLLAALLGVISGCADTACADTWIEVQSEHFRVYSNSSLATAKIFATKLEGYYYTLYALYKMKNADSDTTRPKFTTFLLKDRRDLRTVWPEVPEVVAGFYSECEEGTAAYATYSFIDTSGNTHLKRGKGGYDFTTLFHEYAHHFMYENYAVALPAWYVEGFAEYFSTMQIEGRDIVIGQTAPQRYSALFTQTWLDYANILRGVRPKDTTASLQFYAQSWLLAHYILSSPERLKQFGSYIDDINDGADPVSAFETHLGVKAEDLPRILKAYMQNGVPAVSFTFDTMPVPDITLNEMHKSADKLLPWKSVLETCNSRKMGPNFLADIQAEASRYADDPWAQMVKARAELVIGDIPPSESTLLARNTAAPQDHEAQYLLGRLYYNRATAGADETNKTADMQSARSALLKAYKLDPLYAPGLYYLSLAQGDLPTYPNTAAVNAAVQASNLTPSVDEYAWYAAHLLIVKDRSADAAIILTPLAANPHNPASAKRARTLIDAIKTGRPKDELLNLLQTAGEEDSH